MGSRVFRAVFVARIAHMPEITDIMVERGNHTQLKHALIQPRVIGRALAAIHQACHGQRDIQHMLNIVIIRVAGVIVGVLAAIQSDDIAKRPHYNRIGIPLVQRFVDAANRVRHLNMIGGIDLVSHVKLIAAIGGHDCPSL